MRMPCNTRPEIISSEIALRMRRAPRLSVSRSGRVTSRRQKNVHHRHQHEELDYVNKKEPARVIVEERHMKPGKSPCAKRISVVT